MKKLDLDVLSKNIINHANDDLADGKLGGAEILVNQDGKRVFHEVFGKKSYETNEDLRKGALYRAASMTKPITTVAVLKLVEEGKISLDDEVSKYYPEAKELYVGKIVDGKIEKDHIANKTNKIRNLLNHTSGIGSGNSCGILGGMQPYDTLENVAKFYASAPLDFDPESSQSYSPTAAFDVAAGIVQMISGMNYEEYLKKYIFEPIGMTDTTFFPTKEQFDRIIIMHARTEEGKSIDSKTVPDCVFESFPCKIMSAGAGLLTSAEDYSKFAEMLVNEGTARNGAKILSTETVKLFGIPTVSDTIMPGSQKWSLGVRLITDDDYRPVFGLTEGCFGWSGAYGTHFWVDPQNKITAVYMKNCRYDGGAGSRTGCVFEQDVARALGNFPTAENKGD